jgi:hypothetical protein
VLTDRRRVVLGGMIAALAIPLGILLAQWLPLQTWSVTFDGLVDDRGGVWRLLRAALAYVAITALLVVAAVLVFVTLRRSRRAGLVLGGAMLVGNIMVQVVKHPVVLSRASIGALDPLSGHVGVATAVALAAIIVLNPKRSATAATAAGLLVSAVGVGVVLAGWHSLAQVICPFVVLVGWMIMATGFLPRARPHPRRAPWWIAGIAALAGAGLTISALACAAAGPLPTPSSLAGAVLIILGAVVGVVIVGITAMLVAARSTCTIDEPARGTGGQGVSAPT